MNIKLLAIVLGLISAPAHAALNVRCDAWQRSGDLSLSVNLILVEVIGQPEALHPSVVTIVDDAEKKLVFSDEISHLNLVDADGSFKKVEKKFYPLKPGGNPLKPEPVIEVVRELDLKMKLKADNALRELNLKVDQSMGPQDTTFTGDGHLQIGNKKYSDVTFNCGVYIDWRTYKRMLDKYKPKN